MKTIRRIVATGVLIALSAAAGFSTAQTPAARQSDSSEARTARYFRSIREKPPELLAFLREMPKGGDLHNHLSGAIYAESYVRWAVEDNLCLIVATMTLALPPCDPAAGRPTADVAVRDPGLYGQVINAWSMRHWDTTRNGRDHFFNTFGRFGQATSRTGDMLAEVAARAAAERVSYLELMLTPDGGVAARLGREAGWDSDFARLRDRLLASGFRDTVLGAAHRRLDAAEARKRELLRCGTDRADPGCTVTLRFIAQVARAGPPEAVFAQMIAGFELAATDPRVVSINLVQPEDDVVAVRDFMLQMTMLDFLQGAYSRVPITLHAGELVDGLVPPEALRFHIRASIEKGHARRIGHGVSIAHEDGPFALLRHMATSRVLVEAGLTSNDIILGVKGKSHPLKLYLEHGVPVALVTDDAGVSRASHTHEFRKAVEEHGLDYLTLKQLARNSLEYAFADEETKTRLKRELERSFEQFERKQAGMLTRRGRS